MTGMYYRVSSSATLFFKIFFPTFWIVFFGSFLVLVVFFGEKLGYAFSRWEVKAGFLLVFGGFYFLISRTLMRLKRIELTSEAFYVTNYFKTYRYTYDGLEKVHTSDYGLFKILSFRFKARTAFGKRVFCIQRTSVWHTFLEEHPGLLEHAMKTQSVD